jgi:hypothetical protein
MACVGAGNQLVFHGGLTHVMRPDVLISGFINCSNGKEIMYRSDRLCGLVVRALDYISRGPGFDSRHYQKKK